MKIFTVCSLLALSLSVLGGAFDLENGEFILGFYSADNPNDANFQLIQDAGINYVHTYSTGDDTPEALERAGKFLDLAQKYQLKVMFDIKGKKWVAPGSGIDPMLNMIRRFKDHPALGMWYLYDEPKIELVPQLEEIHRTLQKETPDIPCSLVIHWITDWYKTRTACDLWMVDGYPVRDQEFPESNLSNYNVYVKSAIRLTNPSKPVIGVMQSMNWECMKESLGKGPEAKFRFPNPAEMRNMAYASIALGVRGLFFYSFYHIHVTPVNTSYHKAPRANMDWYLEVFKPFCLEIKDFTTLVHPAWQVTASDDQLNKDHKVYLGHWRRSSGNYLLLTNDTKENRDLKINLNAKTGFPKSGTLSVWGQTRPGAASLANGILTVRNMAPWESFVWEIE